MARLLRLTAAALAGVAVVLIIVAAFRKPLASAVIEAALRNAGFDHADIGVDALSLSRAAFSNIRIGAAPDDLAVDLERAALTFDWRAAAFDRRLEAISIGPGRVRLAIDETGAVRLPGAPPSTGGGETGSSAFALERLTVEALEIDAQAPTGDARATIDATFTDIGAATMRGEAKLDLDAALIGLGDITASDVDGDLKLALSEGGRLTVAGRLRGDAAFQEYRVNKIDAVLDASLDEWRAVSAFDQAIGAATLRLNSGAVSGAQALLDFGAVGASSDGGDGVATSLPPIREAALAGAVRVEFDRGDIDVRLPTGMISATSDAGQRLTLNAPPPADGEGERAAIFSRRGDLMTLALEARVDDQPGLAKPRAHLSVRARSTSDDDYAVKTALRLGPQSFAGLSVGDVSLEFEGVAGPRGAEGGIAVDALVDSATVGRFAAFDVAAAAAASVRLDLEASTATIGAGAADCVRLARGRFTIASQDLASSLADASACAVDAPLAIIDWSNGTGDPEFVIAGRLAAARGFFRLGQTVLAGAPPRFDFALRSAPARFTSQITGTFSGGAATLNDALKASKTAGAVELRLEGAALTADIRLDDALIEQALDSPLAAPMRVRGSAKLRDDKLAFDGALAADDGSSIGRGRGVHDVALGEGFAEFATGDLAFTAGGLQPSDFSPVFIGLVSEATGGLSARMRFDWTTDAISSGGDIDIDNVSFRGPGLAVSRTGDIDGVIRLTSLMPPATDGLQDVAIGVIDLDALKLEGGGVRFALPGDDTLEIETAEFPWFGGVIGAYDTKMTMKDGAARAVLRASGVDLGALLAFLELDGLSGEGVVEGDLPLVIENGRARIEAGVLNAVGPGVLRYAGRAGEAAAKAGDEAALAFDILRELRFEKLTATVDGPLDGALDFGIALEGASTVTIDDRGNETVWPVIYRININAPLLDLINQARLTTDFDLQRQQAGENDDAEQ